MTDSPLGGKDPRLPPPWYKLTEIEQNVQQAAEAAAAANENEVTADISTPAGAAALARQPQLDLTADPIRNGLADPMVVADDKTGLKVGPLDFTRRSAGAFPDGSFSAASASMLNYAMTAGAMGIAAAGTSEALAHPSGHDMLLIAGLAGAVVLLIGLALNIARLRSRKTR